MNLLLALLPIAVAAVMLVVLQRSAMQAGLATLATAAIVALLAPPFRLEPGAIWMAAAQGAATALTVLLVLFPGLLLYHLLKTSGAIDVLAGAVARLSPRQPVQVLLLVMGLAPFVESVSGFGVTTVIVVPLLIALGIAPFTAAVLGTLSLMAVPWGALAVGTTLGAQLTGLEPNQLGLYTALVAAPLPACYGLVVLTMLGGWPTLRSWWPLALGAGGLLAAGLALFSLVPGIELAGVLASLLTLAALVGYALLRREATATGTSVTPGRLGVYRAVAPYGLLTLLLLSSRMVGPLRQWLLNNAVLEVPALNLRLPLLYTPGFWVLLACLGAVPLLGLRRAESVAALGRAGRQFWPGAVAVVSFLATAQILFASGMVAELSAVGGIFGSHYAWFAPWIGALGGWITGSNVGGNAMFAPLQAAAGARAGLPLEWLMAAQNGAGSHATMVSPARTVLTAAAAGLAGGEGRLLRAVGPLVLGATVLMMLVVIGV
nr:L-lactate permease [Chloroflexaceae bacterium]